MSGFTMKLPKSPRMRAFLGWATAVAIMLPVVTVLGIVMRSHLGKAPEGFDRSVTLEQATSAAKASNQPVLVFGTADWCGPCQRLKRGALADTRVSEWIKANTRPVYLDVDKSRDEAMALGVRSIPVIILMRDDRIIDRLDGERSADDLLAWLRKSR